MTLTLLALTAVVPLAAQPSDLNQNWSRALGRVSVRASPAEDSARIGWLDPDSVFAWTVKAEGTGCVNSQWAELVGGGFACLASTEPATEPPAPLPVLVRFDSPRPEEWEHYLETGAWDRDPATAEALLPYVYGKRWRTWDAPLYADIEAWRAGAAPIGRLAGGGGRRNHFVAVVEDQAGAVLVRPDGRVVPVDRTHVYPIDRFEGRKLAEDPVPAGWLAGWVVAYRGADLLDAPEGAAAARLPYHTQIEVRDAGGGWWEVRNGLGPATSGYLDDRRAMHHWVPRPAPDDVGPDLQWVDIDLDQQVLAIRRGQEVEFVTLVSGGLTGRTPTGLYAVTDKSIHDDMASRAGSDEPYLVEEVPWVVHFRARYALHGTFWHWGFGHRASHGCVNLSPRDAKHVFDLVHPTLPDGWHTVFARPEDPGTVVRIRSGDRPVTDRR